MKAKYPVCRQYKRYPSKSFISPIQLIQCQISMQFYKIAIPGILLTEVQNGSVRNWRVRSLCFGHCEKDCYNFTTKRLGSQAPSQKGQNIINWLKAFIFFFFKLTVCVIYPFLSMKLPKLLKSMTLKISFFILCTSMT